MHVSSDKKMHINEAFKMHQTVHMWHHCGPNMPVLFMLLLLTKCFLRGLVLCTIRGASGHVFCRYLHKVIC